MPLGGDYNDKPDPNEPQKRVSRDDHPDRCQAVAGNKGQCRLYRTEHSPYCIQHGGVAVENKVKREELSNYRLQKYKTRVKEFATNPQVLTLRDEIGIARMVLETKLNKWQNDDMLIAHSGVLLANIQALHKLVMDCKKLESSMGMLLDKAAIQKLCDGILSIMSRYLDEDQMAEVANLILGEIAAVTTARVSLEENQ